jgi:ParB-like chromosome segregation protein Spo0J
VKVPDTLIRWDLGDIAKLAASIADVGLLQPVVVLADDTLVAGRRRIEAARQLGWDVIPVRVVRDLTDAAKILRAQRDENTCRKAYLPSEAVALKKALDAIEAPKAKARQTTGQRKGRESYKRSRKTAEKSEENPKNAVPPKLGGTETNGQSNTSSGHSSGRRAAAKETGLAPETIRKAEQVVAAAEAEPEKFSDLKEQMDATGKVDPAFKELKKRKAEIARCPFGIPLTDDNRPPFDALDLFGQAKKHFLELRRVVDLIAKSAGGPVYRRELQLSSKGGKETYYCTFLSDAERKLKSAAPYCSVCPYCHSKQAGAVFPLCRVCLGNGWVTESVFDKSAVLPAEHLAALNELKGVGE